MRFFILILCICFPLIATSQFTLENAIQGAKQIELTDANAQLAIQDLQVKIQESKRYPLIYGEANLQRNLIIPVTPVPAIAFNPSANPDEMMAMRFATDWSAKAGINASVDIFNPQKKAALADAKQQSNIAALNAAAAKNDLSNTITDLYAQVILAQSQEATAKNQWEQYSYSLNVIKERYEAGRASKIEYNNALKKYDELMHQYKEATLVMMNKQIALRQYVEFSFNDTFATSFESIISSITTADSIDIEKLKSDTSYAAFKLQNNRLNALPTLTFNAYYGANYFHNQLKLLDNNYWHGNSYVNISLRLPITENIEKNITARQLKLQYTLAQEKLLAAQQDRNVQDAIKQNELNNLRNKMDLYERTVALIAENCRLIAAQVDAGTVLITELNNELSSLWNEQQKLWQAKYDYIAKALK